MDENLADDMLVGAKAVAKFLGMTERQVYNLADTDQMPLFKLAGKISGRKSTLKQHVAKLEGAHGAPR